MATTKKTVKKPAAKAAAKKPAAKKPAVKKPAAKPAAKKPAAKKPAAKAAAKKPAVKKPAAKATAKTAVKKPAAKKPAAAKTTAVKKTASAKAAPAKKTAAVKTPAAKKTSAKPVEVYDVKYRDLFDAYTQGKLPFAQGYIVSAFLNPNTAYSIYEIVSYAGVKEIFPSENGLTFQTGGKKLYVLIENDTYHFKPVEPVSRVQGESIPKRFNELEIITARNQTKIMIAKEPNELFGSFTILKPEDLNFSIVFYQLPDLYTTLATFFEKTFNIQRKVPQSDARKAAGFITNTLKKTMSFEGEYK